MLIDIAVKSATLSYGWKQQVLFFSKVHENSFGNDGLCSM